MSTTTEDREEEERGRWKQEIRREGVVEDRTEPLQVSDYTSLQPHLGEIDVFKIATLKINGLVSRKKVEIFNDFLRRQDIDILLLQEVAHSTIDTLRRYKT